MNTKILAALIVLGVAAFWARGAFAKSASATTAGVERDSRLNASNVKGAANSGVPQDQTANASRRVFVRTSTFQQPFRLQPFGYADSEAAAYKAPIFVRDTPSSRLTTY